MTGQLRPALHGIPEEGIFQGAGISRIGLGIDVLVLAHLAVSIVEYDRRPTAMTGGVDALEAITKAFDHTGVWPPKTAPPHWRFAAVRTFVTN